MSTGNNKTPQWNPPKEPQYREPDALDQELALMAQIINVINTNVIRFPHWLKSGLLADYQRCHQMSQSLSKEERAQVVLHLSTSISQKSLFWILRCEMAFPKDLK